MATHSIVLALKIPWTEEPVWLVFGASKTGTRLSTYTHYIQGQCQGGGWESSSHILSVDSKWRKHLARIFKMGNSLAIQWSGLRASTNVAWGSKKKKKIQNENVCAF